MVVMFNAQGDMPTGIAIAKQVTAGDYDLVITSSTPSMQAVANNNREGKVRHLFTLVADPFASGVGLDRADPLKHPPTWPGRALSAGRDGLPDRAADAAGAQAHRRRLESCRVQFARLREKAREVAKTMGLTLLEANVDTTSAVTDAINSLICARRAGDLGRRRQHGHRRRSARSSTTAHASAFRSSPILPGTPDRGTLFDAGPDFYEVGTPGRLLAADILDGADMTRFRSGTSST